MNHAMIDLETLSTRSDAKVLSIGVAIFDDKQVIATDGWAIDLADDIGGHVDWKTVKWWLDQEPAAREFSWGGKLTNANAAFNLKTFMGQYNAERFWSKDPHFDHVILENWWRRINETTGPRSIHVGNFPIHYRDPRSVRTVIEEAELIGYDTDDSQYNYVAHNPIDDASVQARQVIEARRYLARGSAV